MAVVATPQLSAWFSKSDKRLGPSSTFLLFMKSMNNSSVGPSSMLKTLIMWVDINNTFFPYSLPVRTSEEISQSERLYALGQFYQYFSLWPQSIEKFKKVIEISPGFLDAYHSLASIYRKRGMQKEYEQVYKDMEEVLGISEEFGETLSTITSREDLLTLGYNHFNATEIGRKQSIMAWGKLVEIYGHYKDAYYGLGNALRDVGMYGEALRAYSMFVKHNPTHIFIHYEIGGVLNYQGMAAEAIKEYEIVRSFSPDHLPTLLALGALYQRFDRMAEARDMYKRANKMDPGNNTISHYLLKVEKRMEAGDSLRGN